MDASTPATKGEREMSYDCYEPLKRLAYENPRALREFSRQCMQDKLSELGLINQTPTIDQWHYPSKGDMPPKREQVLCLLWNGNYIVAFIREDNEWTTNGKFAFDGVKCWQYIIPPKDEA